VQFRSRTTSLGKRAKLPLALLPQISRENSELCYLLFRWFVFVIFVSFLLIFVLSLRLCVFA
jgi:cytochrome oxidase assembly protein ShyY1